MSNRPAFMVAVLAAVLVASSVALIMPDGNVAHAQIASLPLKNTTPIPGSTITGSQTYPNTTFGFSFSDIGDLDNDGVTDLAIGAPGLTNSLTPGIVYITLMNSDGSVKNTIPISSMTPNGPSGHGGGDRFGNSVAGIGDIDGDGIPDVAAGAPGAVAGPSDTGNVYVMLMNRDGTIKRTVTINSQTPNIPAISSGDRFGWALAGLGDLNDDGIPEIAVGSPGSGLGGITTGNVYILFMDRDGSVKDTMAINDRIPNGPTGLTNDDLFGWSIANIGDLDADGTIDMAIGAPGHIRGGAAPGKMFIMYMNSDGTVKGNVMIGSGTPGVPALVADDRFANSIAGIGDRNGDNIPDIAASSPGHLVNGEGTGDVHIFYMNRSGSIQNTITINNSTPNGPSSVMPNHTFGVYLSNIRDLDNDGVAELGASALGGDSVYVFFMNANGTIKRTADIRDSQGAVSTDRFGQSMAGIGDLDGDGVPDIMIGAPGRPLVGNSGGDVYVMFMGRDGMAKRTIPVNTPSTVMSNDNFGWSVANIGDLDGDGVTDVAVGAPGESYTGTTTSTGDVYVMFMGRDGMAKRTMQISPQTPNGPSAAVDSKLGWSVAGVGDLDGDGVPDIAAGAPSQSLYRGGATAATGDVYLMLMNPDGTIKRTVEINGQVANGPNLMAGDRFGESVAGIGDLDGDGVPDIMIGAPGHSIAGMATGDVYVMMMNSDGTIKRTIEINGTTLKGPSNLANGDRFGASAVGTGDLDGDGVPDIMIGAPGHLLGNDASGSIYAILMNANGTIQRTMELNANTANGPRVDGLGWSAAGIGDLDGDGRQDIATGVPSSAYAYVSFMSELVEYVPLQMSAKIDGATVSGMMTRSVATFGQSVSDIGDLDGDGISDVAIGAPGLTNSKASGDVYITLLNSNGSVKNTIKLNSQTPNGPAGHGSNDRFGQSVVGIGDLNGDGIPDIAAGAPGVGAGPTMSGDVYIMMMNRDGTIQRTVEINDTTPNGPSGLANGDHFGWALAGMGDLNGDGIPDIAAGAPGPFIGGVTTGDVYIMMMNRDGSVKDTVAINDMVPNGPTGLTNDDLFGRSVANIGDLDGDGTTDMAIGAPGHGRGGADAGKVFITYMNPNGTVKSSVMIGSGTPGVPALVADDRFGHSVSGLGDSNSDGIPDIAVAAPSHPVNGADSGDIYVFNMNRDGTIRNTSTINSATTNGPNSVQAHHKLGVSLTNVADLDGDGVSEIAAGAGIGNSVYVMFMNADGTVKRTAVILSSDAVRPDNRFGNSVAGIGDLNRDGIPDMFVGMPGTVVPSGGSGDAYVLLMNSNGAAANTIRINASTPNGPSDLMANDYFGWSVAGIGDVDGDGVQDIAAGAPGAPFFGTGTGTGSAYVMLMNPDGTIKNTTPINSQTPNGPSVGADSKFGWSVAGVGDIDSNGTPDIAVGAPSQSFYGGDAATATGDAYLMMMNPDGTVKSTVEINGQVANGPSLAAGDRFGESIAGAGDLDRDGVPDIVVGAPGHAVGGTATGDIYVVFMNSDGTIKSTVEINGRTPNGPPNLATGDRLGSSVAVVDLDGDGIMDIAAGAPGHVGGSTAGDVYVMFMNSDVTIKRTLVLNSNTPSAPGVDGLGWALATIGDLDANGIPEIAIGDPSSAYVHVAYMSVPSGMGVVRGTVFADSSGDGMRDAGEAGMPGVMMTADTAGMSRTTMTGPDGTYSFVVNPAPAATTVRTALDPEMLTSMASASLAPAAGQTLTFDVGVKVAPPAMSADLPVRYTSTIEGTPITGSQTYPHTTFGFSFSDIGDLDNDGVTDLAIGAPGLTHTQEPGTAYVALLNADGTVKNTFTINSSVPNGPAAHGGGDRFGNSVAGIGDLNGDGVPDVAVGAPGAVAGPAGPGNAYVMLMNRDGTIQRTITINSQTPNIPAISSGDRFGWALAGLGDLDRDGVPDIAVGSPGNGLGGITTGNVYILFMNRDGSVKDTMTINDRIPNGPTGLTNDDLFGWSIANIGDLDADGTIDMAIGAPGHIRGGAAPGKMFIMYMNSDGTIKGNVMIGSGTPGVPALLADDRFANSIAGIGDRNGDGIPDIAASAPGHLVNGADTGDVYIFYMNRGGSIQNTITINDKTPNGPLSVMPNHTFGVYLSNIRDLDGDGVAELGASALGGDSVYIFFMNANGTIKRTADIADTRGADSTDRFGQSVTGIGDLDNDGVADMLVGAPGRPLVGNTGGDAYILFMNSNGMAKRTIPINAMTTNGPSGVTSNDNFGWSVTSAGDINGDGVVDIAVGAPGESYTGTNTGTGDVYLMLLNRDGTILRTIPINAMTPNGPSAAVDSKFGWSVASIGDVDSDGTPDLAAGAPNHTLYRGGAATTTGDVYLMLMNPDGTIKRTMEINGQVANGPSLAAGDRFGESIVGIGDLDNDGTPDMLVGAPGHSIGGVVTGDAYIILLNADGTVKRTMEINGTTANGPARLVSGDRFGASAASADVDNDGTRDLVIGAPGHLLSGGAVGDIYVLLMNSDGTVKRTLELSSDTANGPRADDLGWSVAGIGDLDGNGMPEIAMGAPDSATMYVVFTGSLTPPQSIFKMSANAGLVLPLDHREHKFGDSVADIGDVNKDGTSDLAVGAPGLLYGAGHGEAYVLLMNPNGTVNRSVLIDKDTANAPQIPVGDRFGDSVARIGDIDDDGVPDLLVGATGHTADLNATGKAHIIMLNRDASIKRTVTIDASTANGPMLSGYDLFGTSVAGVGDINNDGIPDIAAGAPNHLVNGDATGDVYVMLMNRDGTIQRTIKINGTTPNGPTLGENDRFGTSVAGVGDIDNDGIPDLAAGAPGHRFFNEGTGDLFVMFMNSDGTIKSTVEINAMTPNGPALAPSEIFGISVAGVGDINNDGIPDIAAGSPAHRDHGIPTGDVFVMMMNSDGTIQRTIEINNLISNGPPLVPGSAFGISITGIGDRDGDGIPEIAAGTLETENVYVSFMNRDGTIKRSSVIDGAMVAPPKTGTVMAGASIDGIGDLDADGTPDLLVGAPGSFGRAANTGDAYVMFMGKDGMAKRTVAINGTTPNGPSLAAGDRFGNSVAGIGDINGDGVPDVAVSATGHAVGHVATGDVYVIMMNRDGTIQRTMEINAMTPNGPTNLAGEDRFGTAIAGVGDIDGDGVPEIAVGAAGHNVHYGPVDFTGDIYLMFMNSNGSVKRTMEINAMTPNGPVSLGADDRLGAALAGIGDLDGDGTPDMATGSPFHHEGDGVDTGEIYIMMMNPDGTVKRTAEIGIGTPNGPAIPDRSMLGFSITGIGDMDGDGTPDILAGAPSHLGPGKCGITEGTWSCLLSRNSTDRMVMGNAHVLYMNSDGTIKRTTTVSPQATNAPAIGSDDYMGISLANAGDIDGDGIADIAFGAPYTSSVYVSLVNP